MKETALSKEGFGELMVKIINETRRISREEINTGWPPSSGCHINLIQTGYIRGSVPFIVEICIPVVMNHKLREKADSIPELKLLAVPENAGYGHGEVYGFMGRASRDSPEEALLEAFEQLLGKIEMVKKVRGWGPTITMQEILGNRPA